MKSLGTFTVLYDDGQFVYVNIHQSSENGFYEVKYIKEKNHQIKRTLIESNPNSDQFSETECILLYSDNKSILERIYQDVKMIIKDKFPCLAKVYMGNLYYAREEMHIIEQHLIDYNLFIKENQDEEICTDRYISFTFTL